MWHTPQLQQSIMKNKFHEMLIGLACLVSPFFVCAKQGQSAWQDSPVGRCFSSINDFLAEKYGPDYTSDDNIKTIPLRDSKSVSDGTLESGFIWAIDATPGVNITRTLLKIKDNGQTCAILYAPLCSEISLQYLPAGGLPKLVITIDSPPPDFNGNKVIYGLNKKTSTYRPLVCYKVKNKKTTKIPCNRAFLD